jgi:Helicase C-terminal domain
MHQLVIARRCVVMMGMPYPNPADVELRERMAFMDAAAAAAAVSNGVAQPTAGSLSPGQQYYQDLCMKVRFPCKQHNEKQWGTGSCFATLLLPSK